MKRVALVAGFALLLLAGIAFYSWIVVVRGRYEARVEELRAAREPTRVSDLATPPIPDEENAAIPFARAEAWLERHREGAQAGHDLLETFELLDDEYTDDWTEEEWQKLREHVAGLEPYVELLRQTAARPGWHVDHNWEDGPLEIRIDPIIWLQNASRHLITRVRLSGESVTGTAIEAALLHLDLADRCDLTFLLGHLVRDTVRTQVGAVLRHAMRNADFDAARFRSEIDERFARAIPTSGPSAAALRSERVTLLWILERWTSGQEIGYGEEQTALLMRAYLYQQGLAILDRYEEAIRAADGSPQEALQVAARFAALPELTYVGVIDPRNLLRKVFLHYVSTVANLRLTRVVMALLEHRQEHGAWPARLGELRFADGLPLDPYTEAPFAFERTDDRLLVFAAKPDTDREDLEESGLAWSLD